MPDITKCQGTNCPKKEQCYRYTSKSDKTAQSYFIEPPIKNGECEYFWPIKKKTPKEGSMSENNRV